jgi:thioredoxin 1
MAHVFTDETFAQEVLQSATPVLVDFWAEWCGPCRAMGPIIDEIAQEVDETKLRVGKLNVDQAGETAMKYNVMSIPTFLVFQNGEVVEQIVGGMSKEAFKAKLSRFIA